jgi:hypothetical protein
MARDITLTLSRQEAEDLVDLLEGTQSWGYFHEVAADLRKQWGMCSREVEMRYKAEQEAFIGPPHMHVVNLDVTAYPGP